MHFDLTFGFTQIFSLGTLIYAAKIHKTWVELNQQHGMMWRDYKKRHGINGNWKEHPDFKAN